MLRDFANAFTRVDGAGVQHDPSSWIETTAVVSGWEDGRRCAGGSWLFR
jgi:hypothetical protein